MAGYIVLAILVISHIGYSLTTIALVRKSHALTNQEKKLQYFLICLMPFLWAVIARNIIKRTPGYHEPHKDVPVTRTYFTESDLGE